MFSLQESEGTPFTKGRTFLSQRSTSIPAEQPVQAHSAPAGTTLLQRCLTAMAVGLF